MTELSAAVFPLTGNQLIEASAGTGKTHTITNLYIRLLLGHGRSAPLAVSNILVLTFTIAATEELKYRIRQRIVQARRIFSDTADQNDDFLAELKTNSKDPDRDLKLLIAATQLMDDAAIFTIHGFCARVLGELSFETGVLFDQRLDADRDALLRTAAEDCFREYILGLPDLERQLALDIWSNPQQLAQKVRPFLFRSELKLEPAVRDVTSELSALQQKITTVKRLWINDNLPEIIEQAGFRRDRKVYTRIKLMTEFCQSPDVDLGSELWTVYNAESLRRALKKDGSAPDHRAFSLINEIWASTDIVDQLSVNLWHGVIESLRLGISTLKARTGELTLDDLLVQLHGTLEQSDTLARDLSLRWPVAMVDEFQDTDDLQYGIFDRMHRSRASDEDTCLLFIGDPKQAIYQFRDADIYTYINAREQADSPFSLSVNWRATRPMVDAINHLFARPGVFGDDTINYEANSTSEKAEGMTVSVDGAPVEPCHVSFINPNADLTQARARELGMGHAAEQVVQLLGPNGQGAAIIDNQSVGGGQIAVLVRDRYDARAVRRALNARGVRSVYVTQDSVLLQDTAEDLRLILEAVIDPANDRAIKAALATTLLNCSAQEVNDINAQVLKSQLVLTEFQRYQQLWATRGVASMIEALIVQRRIAHRWLHQPGGERQLTNLRHLSELLQQRSATAPGMHRLLKWFTRERAALSSAAADDRQLRLESDENLVKIVTIHAAKGLEFDIVMVPMAGFASSKRNSGPVLYHRKDGGDYTTHLNLIPDSDLKAAALQESYEEDMRLLYVAVTRSRYLCYLGVPNATALGHSAIGRLFGLNHKENRSAAYLRETLPEHLFRIVEITGTGLTRRDDSLDASTLRAPPALPVIDDRWRIHSYTGVSRRLRKLEDTGSFAVAGYGDDDDRRATATAQQYTRFTFPRGPGVGIALHSLLEDIDFSASEDEIRTSCERHLPHMGVTAQQERWLDVLTTWIAEVLQSPLPGVDGTFALADIPREDRLNELEFHFPVALSDVFLNHLKGQGYLQTVLSDQLLDLTGMMTGLIDLVARVNGRYYLIDYKSNHLGDDYERYSSAALAQAVEAHNYDLQYFIYCIALHRFLEARLADYDYDRSFGGVMYLFLRGMHGDATTGVFTDSPPRSLIAHLNALLNE